MKRIHQFNFEPPARQEEHARVTRWAEAMIAEGLSLCFAQGETKAEQELSRTSEVLRGLGQYLVSHDVVREIESVLRRASLTTFVLKGKVKVTFSLSQGRKSVASVSKGQEQQPGNSSALFILDPGETAHAVHIAENHIGVIDLVVADLGHALQAEQIAGIWWRAIYTLCGRCSIMATNDGIKLRSLSPVSPCTSFLYIVAATLLSSNCMALPNPPHRNPLGGRAKLISSADDTCHLEKVLQRHGIDDMPLAPYSQTVDDAAWIYTLLDDNETSIEIWWGSIGDNGDTMGLRTSKGREVFLGFVGAIPDLDWELVSTPAMNNYRFCYDSMSYMGIGGLAFEDPSPIAQGVQPLDPTTIVPPMPDFRYCVEPFFFSSANLQDLSKIKVCQIPYERGISGLLLTYINGHKEALGEVRLNCLESPIGVGKQDRNWLRFEYDPTGIIDEHPRLVEISFSRIKPIIRDGTDPATAGLNCLEVLFTDELHWWWSPLQCQVFYEGQGSLQPRDAEKWLLFDD
ncbi:hypothetical protein FVEG_02515 [Fusarium verticillioides 7600]|uniref:Uncharacterized protein n=1 Tax=Gibberella moniliformis (strain M3125 / FGSC 7600) TaxID=334819 RepID=W7M4H3_GIBM7|nr:hypothetical protein FVEG_02515 [Fusarium verticillioides 7600]EWG39822.1 hypothetical protein FVEG_02515 [Fusarium verticillioides 7600]